MIDERRGCNSLSSWATPDHIFVAARIILCSAAVLTHASLFPARCEVVAKKASTGSVAGNVRTDIVVIRALLRVLVERAVPAGPAGQPRGAHDTPAAALAQRLRGVVVDGRIDCPAQTSAFSDAAMSWFARARLRRAIDSAGECALRRCASSQEHLRGYPRVCAHYWRDNFRTANPIRLQLLRGHEIKSSAVFATREIASYLQAQPLRVQERNPAGAEQCSSQERRARCGAAVARRSRPRDRCSRARRTT